jgi:ATP-binding cassette subfamily B (MDR/TAP) protein 1
MRRLFRFADFIDYILITIGSLAAIGNGLGLPIFTLLFKDLVNNGFGGSTGTTSADVKDVALQFLYLAIALMVCGTIASGCLLWSAARQGAAMRQKYLRCILRQDISWFDTTRTGEITTSIERDCANVQGAIGEKMSVAPPFHALSRNNSAHERACACPSLYVP